MEKLADLTWMKLIKISLALVVIGAVLGLSIGVLVGNLTPGYYAVMFDADPALSPQIGVGQGVSQGASLGVVIAAALCIGAGIAQNKRRPVPISPYPRPDDSPEITS